MTLEDELGPTAAGSGRKGPSPGAKADPARIRRRNRMITSCLECRRRKLKCDKLHPCTNCSKFHRDCVFLAPALDTASQLKLTEIKEKMGSLERVLEQDVARRREQQEKRNSSLRKTSHPLPGQDDSDEAEEVNIPDEEKALELTPLAIQDAAYEDDADDDIVDLGFKFGKMRVTERIGGFFRPKMAEELTVALNDWQQTHVSPEDRVAEGKSPMAGLSPSGSFMEPGPEFIAPRAGFFFGVSDQSSSSLIDFLPSRVAADRLLQQYQAAVHPVARVVYWPSLQMAYESFWTNVAMGIEPVASLQALIFSILFSAAVSMSEKVCMSTFGIRHRSLVDNFQQATEMALSKANFLRTTKVETLQALVIYIIPMCRNEMSRAHSGLVSAAVRLAECMGLHRDPTLYGLSPVEVHVRRLLWYQLCFLDIRTCEAYGPRPLIRRDEFDTEFPLNVDELDLVSMGEPKDQDHWTDMTLMRIRFECNEMYRQIWHDRIRLEKRQISLTHLLGKVEAFRKALESRYLSMLNATDSLQRLARCLMSLFTSRMHIMVLHRYHYSFGSDAPERLRQLLVMNSIQSVEDAIEIETNPDLSRWAWYSGVYQQYHAALLLLIEIFSYPMRLEADRIWKCLDYVFDADIQQSRPLKGRQLLSELRDKFGTYRDLRKMRAPINMSKNIEGKAAKGPGAYASSSENSSRLDSRSPPELPLNFNSRDWQPVKHVIPDPPVESTQNTTRSSASSAAKSNWGFDSPASFFVVKTGAANTDPAPSYPPPPASNQPSIFDTVKPTSQAPELSRGYFDEQILPPLARTTPEVPSALHIQPTSNDTANDIDWHEWDQIFPQGSNRNEPKEQIQPLQYAPQP